MDIKPQIMPRDITDLVVVVVVGLFQVFALFVLPSLIIGIIFGNFIIFAISYFVFYGTYSLFVVRKISVDDSGILFHRVLGFPKSLEWTYIDSVERASRTELIIRGWLWPLFPAREMTACLSCRGHFRIKWGERFCYFPPRNEAEFEELVRKYINST